MPLLLLMLFLIRPIQSESEESSKENLNPIIEWWNQVSVQKPLQCYHECGEAGQDWKTIPDVAKPYLNKKANKRPIVSLPCSEINRHPGAARYSYTFKGEVKNDIVNGPGKLEFVSASEKKKTNHRLDNAIGFQDVCFVGNSVSGKRIKSVVGTFVNGILEGSAKLTFNDGSATIANFKDGFFFGHRRDFGPDKMLSSLSYHHYRVNSKHWFRLNNYLVLVDDRFVQDKKKNEESLDIAIPMDGNDEVLVGTYQSHYETLVNVHSADIFIEDNTDKDKRTPPCLLKIRYKIKEIKGHDIMLGSSKRLPLYSKSNESCTINQTQSNATPEDQFIAWHNQLLGKQHDANNKAHFENLNQLKPVLDPVNHGSVRQPFITNLSLVSDSPLSFNMSIWDGPITTWKAGYVSIDTHGQLHGVCNFKSNEEFNNKTGRHELLDWSPRFISGRFVHGQLEGIVIIHTWRSNFILATFKEGVMHGPVYVYGLSAILDIEARGFIYAVGRNQHHAGNHFLGRFKNGQADGAFWIGMIGNGYLHGHVDNASGHVSGDKIAYIYPDGETAFLGKFQDRVMKKAKAVNVLKYGCDDSDTTGMFVVKEFSDPVSDQEFFYEPPTNISFGGGAPLGIVDPYELKTVRMTLSSVEGSGEGVFALRDIPKGRFSCLYSLFYYRYPDQADIYRKTCVDNVNKTDDYRRDCLKYSAVTLMWQGRIDLPPEFDVNPLPTMGPKVNHHFRFNNSVESEIEHPRFGLIQSMTATTDIKAGQEIYANYGYEKPGEFPGDFPWYWEAKRRFEEEEQKMKSNKNILP